MLDNPDERLASIARRFEVDPNIVSQIRMMAHLPPRGAGRPKGSGGSGTKSAAVTERAAKIRALVAEGQTHRQIAAILGISVNTVKKTLKLRRADPWYPRPTSFFQE
jgi:DNA-binding NarL/FixJ family response regulator